MNRRIYDAAITVVLAAVLALSGYEFTRYAFAAPPLSSAVSIADPSNNGNQASVDANQHLGTVACGSNGSCPSATSGNSDALPATNNGLITLGWNYVFNGTSWDRLRGTANAGMSVAPYGVNQTPITGNATGTTGAVVGTLVGTAGKTTYICGFNVSAVGGTATLGPITIAGLVGSSQTYQLFSTATGVNLSQNFTPCIPASAANTAITTTTTADGTATAVDVNSWGYQL